MANRLKNGLSKEISKEPFGFLFNRKFLDVTGIAKEDIHSIKDKKLLALVLKLDMKKTYDEVD